MISNWVGSSCRLGTAGSQGLKPGALVAPSPSPAPLSPLGASPGAKVPSPALEGRGRNGLVSRVANPRARGASEEAPALGLPGAAGFPRQSTNAPERSVWRPRRAQRQRSASPAPPPRVLSPHRVPDPRRTPPLAPPRAGRPRRRQPAPPGHCTPVTASRRLWSSS